MHLLSRAMSVMVEECRGGKERERKVLRLDLPGLTEQGRMCNY